MVVIFQFHTMQMLLASDCWIASEDVISFPQFLDQGLSVPSYSTEDVNHAVVVIRWGECFVPEPAPDDDDENPCGVEGISPLVVGERKSAGLYRIAGKLYVRGYSGFFGKTTHWSLSEVICRPS
jgi:hypothetical protein